MATSVVLKLLTLVNHQIELGSPISDPKGLAFERGKNGIYLTQAGIIWGNNVSKVFFSDKYRDYGLKSRMKFAKGKR